jgi:hypothetical protein
VIMVGLFIFFNNEYFIRMFLKGIKLIEAAIELVDSEPTTTKATPFDLV